MERCARAELGLPSARRFLARRWGSGPCPVTPAVESGAGRRPLPTRAPAPEQPRNHLPPITSDHGTEFHGDAALEARTTARVYFATPQHAWERGTNENTDGLVWQSVPKRTSLVGLTRQDCTRTARQLNHRPRKRLAYRTPEDCYAR
jgi:hypothetical protein